MFPISWLPWWAVSVLLPEQILTTRPDMPSLEATHGTAPNIAGKDIVNPCSIILSAVMMLEYFDWKESASLIEHALEQSF